MTTDTPPTTRAESLRESLRLYVDRRLAVIFVLGISSGFPWVLIGSAMSAWLAESGLTRTAIGVFGSIFAVYAWNFAWAPLVDRVRLPLVGRLGQRRSWIFTMQLLIAAFTLGIAFTDPSTSLLWTSIVALGIAVASATQDVSIDAYRIETMAEHEAAKIPAGSAMATGGWWTGYSLPGAVAFYLSDLGGWGWGDVYLVLAGIALALAGFVLFIAEPVTDRERRQRAAESAYREALFHGRDTLLARVTAWATTTIVEPFREFFVRNGVWLALGILAFLFLFKVGEAFLGRMSIVFYKEVGFTNSQIATYSKLIGWWVTIVFAVIGSIVNARFGIVRGLIVGGTAMAATNLMFAWIALVGPDTRLFAAAVVVDNFTAALSTVTFVAFVSYLTSRAYTATQYALMASLGNLGRTTLAAGSGAMVDALDGDWALFFVITTLMVLPSLIILLAIGKKLVARATSANVRDA
jgi:PAT family beta-lactamase induction signal transducer AmpG